MSQKARTGGTPNRAPPGYRNVRVVIDDGREVRGIAVDSERRPLITWAYEAYATGESTNRYGASYPYFVCLGRHQKRTGCTPEGPPDRGGRGARAGVLCRRRAARRAAWSDRDVPA
jgi:hypothetical protein